MKRLWFLLALGVIGAGVFAVAAQPPAAIINVLTWQYSNSRLGQNLHETILNPTNVNATSFGKIFSYPTDGNIYAQPLYVAGVTINGASHNVIYVVTEADSIYAFDADSEANNPNPLWYTSVLNPPNVIAYPCLDNHKACNIYPTIGITGTPVIDRQANKIYFVARTKEIVSGQSNPYYYERLHALDIRTGKEVAGSPATICGDYAHTGEGCQFNTGLFDPLLDGQRPGLLQEPTTGFTRGVLYIGFAGQGMVLAFDPTNLKRLADFMFTPNPYDTVGGGGIWGAGGGISADANGNVYVASGDGTFDANTGGPNYGDSIVKFNIVPSTTYTTGYALQVMDYFTPPDQACRSLNDADLGSGTPMLLPPQPGTVPNLIAIAGKGDVPTCDSANPIYLVNADDMGGLGGGVQTIPSTAAAGYHSSPAYFATASAQYLYWAGAVSSSAGDNLREYKLTNGLFNPTSSLSKSPTTYAAGATPTVSAEGTKNGIVWTDERPESYTDEEGVNNAVLHAYSATNLHTELYNSSMNSTRDLAGPATKFQPPLVINGKVYIGTQTELDVYGLCPCPQAGSTQKKQ